MKTVLITGISRGLGKELFRLFLSKDYRVFGVLRNKVEAKRLQQELPDNGKVILADLSTDEAITSISIALEEMPIDLLINNAGIAGSTFQIGNTESTEIFNLFNVHCLGVFRTVKALESNLLKAETPIVLNLNSRLGSVTRQSNGTYNHLNISYSYRIAKAAQNMLTNCLRNEFRGSIKFISLHPGKMKTDIASDDADLSPEGVANGIVAHYESGKFKEENGIVELGKELIEW